MPQAATQPLSSLNTIISTNPARAGEVLGEVDMTSAQQVQEIVAHAKEAQKEWAVRSLDERIAAVRSLGTLFETYRDEFRTKTSTEMGMPYGLSDNLISGAIGSLEWSCDNAHTYLDPQTTFEDDREINQIIYEPWGVIGCIVAWNFPLPNFSVNCVKPLLAGNAIVMKYSEEVPLFAKYLEQVIAESDLPEGIVNFVYGDGRVGQALVEAEIDALSFTGSSATGMMLYKVAAEKFIPTTLEMGGSSPGVVFPDMEITDELIADIFWKRFLNSGQFCNGLKRLIVPQDKVSEIAERLGALAKTVKLGDPADDSVELGPLVAERQVEKLESQVQDAMDRGAKCHAGGARPAGLEGAYYEPTVLSNISKDMRVWSEEVFGTALPVIGYESIEEAIALANETEYGLNGYIFTNDKDLANWALAEINAGVMVTQDVNSHRPQNPFGGYKASGMGRQGGGFGFHEACQVKCVARLKRVV